MGELDRYNEYKKPRPRFRIPLGQDGNALFGLFTLNIIFFLILLTAQVAYFFYQQNATLYAGQVVQWFELPASLTKLSERPWTILTYMFSDTGSNLMRILSNMLWLWAFGYVLQEMTGNDKIIPIYIYGGVLGGIVFIAANYFIPALQPYVENSALLGANAATMAVAMATTTLSPNHKFFTMIRGGISIWVLMLVYVIIDFAGVATMGAAHSLAHLAGTFAGFLFVVFLKKGHDGAAWMNSFYNWLLNVFNPYKKTGRPAVKDKVFYKTGNRKPYKKVSNVTQQSVDDILDKINQRGYHFLTDEEKAILKKAAEEDL
ncbi:MAG: rhomboid family intramembrane serine protease [Ferruginibacter sp.]